MFGLFKRGSRPKPPTYHVWPKDASRWAGIWKSVEGRSGDGRLLFIAHFDETQAMVHELLEQEGMVAHQLDQPQSPRDLCKLPPGIYVAKSTMIQADDSPGEGRAHCNSPLKIIAIEPHFMPDPDTALRVLLDDIQGDVLYEHHASIEDPPIRVFAGEGTMDMLVKAGFTDDQCLHSPMVSRAIRRAQEKIASIQDIDPSVPTIRGWKIQVPGMDAL